MCNPMAIFAAATVASSVVKGYAAYQQGKAEYQAGMYNAQIAERNAQQEENNQALIQEQASNERRRRGEIAKANLGEIYAKAAANGLTFTGSIDDLATGEHMSYNIDRNILNKNEISQLQESDARVASLRGEAQLNRMGARSSLKAGKLAAFGSLLEGAANVSGTWIQPRTPLSVDPVRAPKLPPRVNKPLPIGSVSPSYRF